MHIHSPSLEAFYIEANCGSNIYHLLALGLWCQHFVSCIASACVYLCTTHGSSIFTFKRSIAVVFPLLSSPTTKTLTCSTPTYDYILGCTAAYLDAIRQCHTANNAIL